MRIFDIINEAPLPDDWDSLIYSPGVSFTKRLAYAKARAKQIGRGSSRVAFEIPYQGRKTILKIAINSKGMAQNEEEAQLLNDYYLPSIAIPIIDHDEQSSSPTWIHTEFAEKISQKQLEKFFNGVSMQTITDYLEYQRTGKRPFRSIDIPDELHENEYFQELQDLVVSMNIPAGDFQRKANWGLYQGNPVIIDLGYTEVTQQLYH